MPKKPKAPAPKEAEVVDGELVDADEAGDVEPAEPDTAELRDEEVPADVGVPSIEDEEAPEEPDGTTALVPAEPSPGRSLARLDPLQLYIQDIRRYPLLSREDEHELAVKFRQTGDVEAARRLVTSNLRLVV